MKERFSNRPYDLFMRLDIVKFGYDNYNFKQVNVFISR